MQGRYKMHTTKQANKEYPNRRRRKTLIRTRNSVRTISIINIIVERCLENPSTYAAVISRNEIIWGKTVKLMRKCPHRRHIIVETSEGFTNMSVFSSIIMQNSTIRLSLNPMLADLGKEEIITILKNVFTVPYIERDMR